MEAGVAAVGGAAACGVSLDDVELGELGVILVAVAELVGHSGAAQRALAADGFTGLAGSFTGTVGSEGLIQDHAGNLGMLLHVGHQLVGDDVVHQRTDVGVTQLCLGLTLKLGLGELDGNDGGDALAAVVAGDLVVFLNHAVFESVAVEHTGQRGFEARFMHTALGGMDVVGKRDDGLVITVMVLQGDFSSGVTLGTGYVDDLLMERRFILIDIGDKLADTALVAHGVALLTAFTLVLDGDAETCIQEGLLTHTGVERFIVILHRVKHLVIGHEGDGGAAAVGVAHDGNLLGDCAAGEGHLVNLALLMHLHCQPLRKSVDDTGTHAVEAAGDLITAAAELTACVQHCKDHLKGRATRLLLNVHGDTTAIVADGNAVALIDGDGDLGTVARQRLINGVIHNLVDKMV